MPVYNAEKTLEKTINNRVSYGVSIEWVPAEQRRLRISGNHCHIYNHLNVFNLHFHQLQYGYAP